MQKETKLYLEETKKQKKQLENPEIDA